MERGLKHISILLLLAALFSFQRVEAQQEAVFSQGIFSFQKINPAYVGVWNKTNISALVRKQWIGFDGSPSTQSILAEYCFDKKQTAFGLTILNDKIGKEKTFGMYGDYSHQVDLTRDVHVRLGFKFGFSTYSNNLNSYTIYDPNHDVDPAFQGSLEMVFVPNFGIGAFLYSDDFYAGISLPKILQNELSNNGNSFISYAQVRHVYIHAGYLYPISYHIKFKPAINTGIVIGAPINIGLSANLILDDQVSLGIMYRFKGSFGLSGQYMVSNNLHLGYAVDFSTSDLSRYNYGTHEVMVSYTIDDKIRRKKIRYY